MRVRRKRLRLAPGNGLLFLAAALTACSCTSQPAVPGRVRISLPTSHPLGYVDKDGTARGFVVEALEAAAARAGVSLEWRITGNIPDNNEALRRGELDVVAGFDSPERRREFFVTDPWWSFQLTILLPAGSPIRGEGELSGRSLAVPAGAIPLVRRTYKPGRIVTVASATGAAEAACSGAADAGIIATMFVHELLLPASGSCKTAGLRSISANAVEEFVLVARHPSAKAARALREGLDAITADGTLTRIAARNPPISTPQATHLADLLRLRYERRLWMLTLAAAAAIALLSAALIYRSAISRRKLRADLRALEAAESALRASEARFRALFDSVPETVVAVDGRGQIVFANSRSSEMFRRPSLIGLEVTSLAAAHSREAFLETRPEHKGTANAGTLTGLRGDGSEFPIEVAWGDVERGKLSLALISDVSERSTLQQQLLQSQKLESLGRLSGGIAHDFNNLLTVIIGYSVLALETPGLKESHAEPIEQIARAAERAAALTRQLLTFSRQQKTHPRRLSLNDLLRNLEKLLRRLIGEDIELVLRLEDIGTIRADPGQMEQVVMNLAVNARDAMPKGGRLSIETLRFEIDPAYGSSHYNLPTGRYAMLRITDTGVGMTPDVAAHIFEPFFTTKEQGKGTGLGLSTVYGIVKQSGGEVLVYSTPGQGTSFKILLPEADGEADENVSMPVPAGLWGAETILVAEDEPDVRRFIQRVLSAHGYTVLEAGDGREALEIASRHTGRIDLLLSDVVMPEIDGEELAGSIRALHPEIRIVLMSGYSDRSPGLEISRLIEKPFTASALLGQVRAMLNS